MTIWLIAIAVLAAYEAQKHLTNVRFVREALQRADLSIEVAARYMENPRTRKSKDPAQLHRQLNGEGHLRYSDLCQLPIKFWQHLGMVILQELGMPREDRRAVVFALALHGKKRMARANAQKRQERTA